MEKERARNEKLALKEKDKHVKKMVKLQQKREAAIQQNAMTAMMTATVENTTDQEKQQFGALA